MQYVLTILGSTCQAIIRTCGEVLAKDTSKPDEKVPAEGEVTDTIPAPEQPSEVTDETKRSRATTVLAALSSNDS